MAVTDEVVKASLKERAIAYLIDTVILTGFMFLSGFFFGFIVTLTIGQSIMPTSNLPYQILGVIVTLSYFMVMEAKRGHTIGKKVMDLKVIKDDGSNLGIKESIIRNLLRLVDYLPVLYIAGILSVYVSDSNQRIGDYAADTLVVKE